MKLVNRISAFFLAALLVGLVGYSAGLFLIIQTYLNHDFDSRLDAALQILTASIEVEPEDVTWFPEEYTLNFESRALADARWIVADETGRIVGQSDKLISRSLRDSIVVEYGRTPVPRQEEPVNLEGWRIAQAYVEAPTPQPIATRESNEFASLVVTVAMSHLELDQTLRRLAVLLVLLPLGLWTLAVLCGKSFARRALSPLRNMISQAEAASGPAFALRLQRPPSEDELADLADAFNRMLEQLQEAFEREQQFSNNAAHQLRTPLTILQGEVEVSLRRPRTAAEYRASLETVATVSEEMKEIVESLLFLARSERASLDTLDAATIEVGEWLSKYVERWTSHPDHGRLDLQIETFAQVHLPVLLLTQVLDNLVDNAIRYSPPDSRVSIILRRSSTPGQIELAVADQGQGIDAGDEERVFDPFFRKLSASREAKVHDRVTAGIGAPISGGAGLGLAVARRIMRLLGGDLEYQRVPNGCEFICYLPVTGRH